MQPDPDIIAIQRKRRQQRRCLRCGKPAPNCTLCVECRAEWRYCPCCETVYARKPGIKGDVIGYCLQCNRVRHGNTRTIAEYHAERKTTPHPLLPNIIRLYKRGLSYREIARSLGRSSVTNIIFQARQRGHWPVQLRRKERT